jgi:hypothetical protein
MKHLMPTFTEEQQQLHRQLFIEECRQKAWSAACHAEWIGKGLEKIAAEYEKLLSEHRAVLEEIAKPETKNNRKPLHDRRDALEKAMNALQENMRKGQQALNGLYQSVEASLQLAKHAEAWKWKEVEANGKA